ncbi:MAG TPA: hypothetical protein VME46_10380 [Acidimicrobiales bacterium]|nr:hypothetical protein [Acidimicrobiales bacterium]
MTAAGVPLQQVVRVRRTDDLTFVRAGLMDEVLVNANQLENSPDSTATTLRKTGVPFSIDPMLTRFQFPISLQNEKGETKRNFRRLAAAYADGTGVPIGSGPLVDMVATDDSWRAIARNVVAYQWHRLTQEQTQVELFSFDQPQDLRPVRILAPALVSLTPTEDYINRVLAEGSAGVATVPLAVPVIVPAGRLLERHSLEKLVSAVPSDGVEAYLIWTPNLPEATLLTDPNLLNQLLRLVGALADRGVPVGHLHGGYVVGALHAVGVSALVHHLGWVDKGEPAESGQGGLRSCQTYVPGLRHCARFENAYDLGRALDASTYARRYCECGFCRGAFGNGQHPLDLLLEDEFIPFKNGRGRKTPTSRAVGVNTWHYLLSRRAEVERFSTGHAVDVIKEDIERASLLGGRDETHGLRRLADQLSAA